MIFLFKNTLDESHRSIKPSKNEEIHWYCPDCENEGVINEWQKTKWDNR